MNLQSIFLILPVVILAGFWLPTKSAAGQHAKTHEDALDQTLQIVTLNNQPWYEAEDRAVAREIASPRNSKLKSMSIAEIKIPAGVVIVPHHHVMEEVYYVVEGKGIMMVEDEEALVQAGQSVVIAPHQWHNIRNHTDEELRLIVTCVPAWAPELLEFDRSTIPGSEQVFWGAVGSLAHREEAVRVGNGRIKYSCLKKHYAALRAEQNLVW